MSVFEVPPTIPGDHFTFGISGVIYTKLLKCMYLNLFLVLQCTGLILPHKSTGKPEIANELPKAAEKGGNLLVFMSNLAIKLYLCRYAC